MCPNKWYKDNFSRLSKIAKDRYDNGKEYSVYIIINRLTGKMYIGKTNHFNRRKQNHVSLLNNGRHPNCYLQEDWNIFGASIFTFKNLFQTKNFTKAKIKEANVINKNFSQLYNMANGALYEKQYPQKS